jgi:hypothetical protein
METDSGFGSLVDAVASASVDGIRSRQRSLPGNLGLGPRIDATAVASWAYCSEWFILAPRAAVVLTALGVTAQAEPPPSVYQKTQKNAPEYLRIKVTGLKTNEKQKGNVKSVHIVVEAKVVRVERSKSGLKQGGVIRIIYVRTIRKKPFVGPSQVPILEKGKEYPAFLVRQEGKTYAPAARGKPFQVVPAPRK